MNEWSRLKLVTPAPTPAVSITEFRSLLGITKFGPSHAIAESTLDAAIALVEGPYGIGRCVGADQTWDLFLDRFPCEITIPLGPVQSVTSITYLDGNGDSQTVASWRDDLNSEPARLWPARGETWPEHLCEPGAVTVRFVAGFTTVPAGLKHAILLIAKSLWRVGGTSDALVRRESVDGVGSWEFATAEAAESVFDKTVERLLAPYRVGLFQ